jgi:hypothetical protein
MKSSVFLPLTFVALLALSATVQNLQAQFIQPVAVLASTGQAVQDTLINGNGFDQPGVGSPDSIHSQDNNEMWSAIGTVKADLVFDLGQTVSLTQVYIWNYNAPGATDAGMKDVEVLVASTANMTNAIFTAIAQIALAEGGQTGQVFNVVGTDVRLVKLRGVSNWGQGYTVGLAEARFGSGTITGHVPAIVVNSPHEGDVINFSTNTILSLDATVTDKDADLAKVEFYDGGTKLGEKVATPYSLSVTSPPVADHAYRFVATDKTGKVAWSTVNVTVREFVADRIIQIDDTADEGAGTNQIKYTGTWTLAQGDANDPRFNHNDHYESNNNKNDYFEVRFVGVKIDVYGTVASHHGTGTATIDGGTGYQVNYKAAVRGEQVHVWSSPILPQREHVLRVRVNGDGVVTADRFDVSVSDKPVDKAVIQDVTATVNSVVIDVEDVGQSVVNPATVKLFLDNALQAPTVSKAGPSTTISNQVATAFQPGSTHQVVVTLVDTNNLSITNTASFTLPSPIFPLTGLGGPASSAGAWGIRQVWNVDQLHLYDLPTAVQKALAPTQPGFTGSLLDTNATVINFGLAAAPAGLFPDDVPFPAEGAGLPADDFALLGRALVVVPTTGDWTIGVHSDEGFALRFKGAAFSEVNGNGARDDNFPEFMSYPNLTSDSSTLGIITNLAAGTYEIEFLSWQRTATAGCEIYAAPGAFLSDGDTDQWQLIGAPTGWQIVAGTPLVVKQLTKTGNTVTIDFGTPVPDSPHLLWESTDLKTWKGVSGATFTKTGSNGVRVSVSNVIGELRYYRISY